MIRHWVKVWKSRCESFLKIYFTVSNLSCSTSDLLAHHAFNWRLITLQYCIGFAIHQHESATGGMYTHVPF